MSDSHPMLGGANNGGSHSSLSSTSAMAGPSGFGGPGRSAGPSGGLFFFRRLQPPVVMIRLGGHAFGVSGEIHHVSHLSEHIGSLYLNDDYSDVTLLVDGNIFQAHKVILAARSEYFRALLFGGLRESGQPQIELKDTSVVAFKTLLRYIYTGKVSLTNLKEDLILDILGLAHKYGFSELEAAVSEYLKAVLNAKNMCTIFGASHLFSLTSLTVFCLDYADKHASEILNTDGFLSLEPGAVEQLISRDSFCAPEIEIFRAAREWVRHHPNVTADVDALIVSHVRLPLMKLDELLTKVRASGLVASERILDAIAEQTAKRDMDLRYRGFMMPNVNVATPGQGAQVIEGELKQALLNGDTANYDMERGFTRHPIDDSTDGIVIQLGTQCIINHIRLLLWDRDQRSYSYFVEVSMDRKDWVRVVDYSSYLCRSWQKLYFPAKVVKYIRVVGTHNTVNRVFHLVALEAYYTTDAFNIHKDTGLIVPSESVATIENSAFVIEGVSRSRNALLNGDTDNYDWDSGYTCHQLGSGAIVVQLAQPYLIDSMRLLLWDCDDRSYSYQIEVSTDQHNWKLVADKTKDACKSWQYLRFDRVPVIFIRIIGTHNTANEVFHCVHFECPALVGSGSHQSSLHHRNGTAASSSSSSLAHQQQASLANPRQMPPAALPNPLQFALHPHPNAGGDHSQDGSVYEEVQLAVVHHQQQAVNPQPNLAPAVGGGAQLLVPPVPGAAPLGDVDDPVIMDGDEAAQLGADAVLLMEQEEQ